MKYPTSMKFMMFLSFFRHCHPCQSDRSPKLFKERRPRDQETMATMGLPGGIYTSLGPFRGSWISGWLVFFLGGIIRMIRGWDKYDQYMIFISFLSRDLAVWTNGALWFQALPSADVLGALRLRWQVEGSHIFSQWQQWLLPILVWHLCLLMFFCIEQVTELQRSDWKSRFEQRFCRLWKASQRVTRRAAVDSPQGISRETAHARFMPRSLVPCLRFEAHWPVDSLTLLFCDVLHWSTRK